MRLAAAFLFAVTLPVYADRAVTIDEDVIQFCVEAAEYAGSAVVNRDAGLSYEKAKSLLELTKQPDQQGFFHKLLHHIYTNEITQEQAYDGSFAGCMDAAIRMQN